MMTLADRNRLVLHTISQCGFIRAHGSKGMEFTMLVESTGLDQAVLRETLDGLCSPTEFSEAALLRMDGDVYAQRIMVLGFDYHTVIERDDGRFAVRRGDSVLSVHEGLSVACDAAEAADHEYLYGHRVWHAPVDATFHGSEINALGEVVCYPEP